MTKQEFINLISFCILMESKSGIIDQAPPYILEKYNATEPGMLDDFNLGKLEAYRELWNVDERFDD